MIKNDKYEAIIGLEIHAQLLTNSKAYSSDANLYGSKPNTNISAISLGHPGTLPSPNKRVIEYAVKLGIALGSKIREKNEYARKNYFYADLPKGYQITQDKTPICNGGVIKIRDINGVNKDIQITRIHMEEDAGKSIHDLDPFHTLVDLNRAGVPLIEIVSDPDIRSSQEALEYINQVKKIVKYLDICDGNMEEGNLRCDANISIRLKGDEMFGTKVEIKNMNSTRNVKKAIDFEIKRQIDILEKNKKVTHETRSFNAIDNSTVSMRHKEEANDYRYFPEPDIQPIIITQEYISKIKRSLPPLPDEIYNKFINEFHLSEYDAKILTEEKEIALFFDNLCRYTKNYKTAANIVNGAIKSYLNETATNIENLEITSEEISELIDLIDKGIVSNTIAINKIFPEMIKTNKTSILIAEENNWIQESNEDAIIKYINDAIKRYPQKVDEYKKGKKGLLGLFMGEVMKMSKGNADPKLTSQLLKNELEK
jgi:aspartyl-tRNA(Asn)/glutamyl-tRNA(Gln) amidotransferase subunit B